MTPVLSSNSGAKVGLVETWTLYEVAPEDAAHERVAGTVTPVAALAGEFSAGAAGGAGPAAVVKLLVAEKALEPPAFWALTLQ